MITAVILYCLVTSGQQAFNLKNSLQETFLQLKQLGDTDFVKYLYNIQLSRQDTEDDDTFCEWNGHTCNPLTDRMIALLKYKTNSILGKLYKCWYLRNKQDCIQESYCVWDSPIAMCLPNKCIYEDIMLNLCDYDLNHFLSELPETNHSQVMLELSRLYIMEVLEDVKLFCVAKEAIQACADKNKVAECLDDHNCTVCKDGECLRHGSLSSFMWTIPEQRSKATVAVGNTCGLDQHVLAGFLFEDSEDRREFQRLMSCSNMRNATQCKSSDSFNKHMEYGRAEQVAQKFWNSINENKETAWKRIQVFVFSLSYNGGDSFGNYEEGVINTIKKYWIIFKRQMLNFPNCKQAKTMFVRSDQSQNQIRIHDEF
eukprot:TRINITY_DN40628_c0_g2_i1.p1 TRINITY_DN40628_c0_g2~~TRINITY_DN40628_c0_g2_i1.p1  ORF type:complete len:370 (+),score=25.50 TRINITY_DN40628_c0_g2_i1:182-1291(+)